VQAGKTQEYVDIARIPDAAMGHFGQIPLGRGNGFRLERKFAWKGNRPSLQEFPPDMFAIASPRRCG
jgi:hypothetical protein